VLKLHTRYRNGAQERLHPARLHAVGRQRQVGDHDLGCGIALQRDSREQLQQERQNLAATACTRINQVHFKDRPQE